MIYKQYLDTIKDKAGYVPTHEHTGVLKNIYADPYIKRVLLQNYLREGVIDKALFDLVMTKSLIENYL